MSLDRNLGTHTFDPAHGLHGLLRSDPSANAEQAHHASRDDHAPPLEIGASCSDLILQTPEPALMVLMT
jgi:hypothetical protein